MSPTCGALPGRRSSDSSRSIPLTCSHLRIDHAAVDPITRANRIAWENASQKHVDEYQEHLERAVTGESLGETERHLLRDILQRAPSVVHLQSGHGLEDIALAQSGARSVLGVDFSAVAVGAAQQRAREIGAPCRYVV